MDEPAPPLNAPGLVVDTTPFGRPATERLRELVADAKATDPLAPVTVLVSSNFAGLSLRRRLAGGAAGPASPFGPGLVNVQFVTLFALAGRLGGATLARAGSRPVSNPVLLAAVRHVLDDTPGVFAPVRDHPATERALAGAFAELSTVDDATRARLAHQSGRAREVVRVYEAVRARLDGWHDEHDLLRAATDAVGDGAALHEVGLLVVHLPLSVTAAAADLLGALARRLPVRVLVGWTGRPGADRSARALLDRLGSPASPPSASGGASLPPTVVSVADADEEVRTVVRRLAERVDAGRPLARRAVVFPSADPYLLALHEQLTAAGIPFSGPAARTLAGSAAGRGLRRLLALPDHDYRRDEVMAWLAGSPVQADGRPVPSSRWDRASREAGVVGGVVEWRERLARAAGRERHAAERLREAGADDDEVSARRHAAERFDELATFVAAVVADLDDRPRGTAPWRAWVDWAGALLGRYLGGRESWPEHEQRDAAAVEGALARLTVLDAVAPPTDLHGFRRVLAAELDVTAHRHGTFGEGVLLVPLALAAGLDLDEVFVVGLAEGTIPRRRLDDSLLPDAERDRAGGGLVTRADRSADDHRDLLAAIAAAPAAVLTVPRGDQRRGREVLASRWLEDEPGETVASFVEGLVRAPVAASAGEHDLRLLLAAAAGDADLSAHPVVVARPALRAGFEMLAGRRAMRFTRFDGNLTHLPPPVALPTSGLLSPTSLEAWATCPRQYFLRSVLQLTEPERPETVRELSLPDRGSLTHDVLERFIGRHLGRDPDAAWTDDDRRELAEVAEEVFGEFEQRGLTGKRVNWSYDRRKLHELLQSALDHDQVWRERRGLSPAEVEMPFGFGAVPPVEVVLPSDRVVEFRGRADRVDRGADGRLAVIDYKTGANRLAGLEDDPVLSGTRLQLPLYALAARAQHGSAATEVWAGYWFLGASDVEVEGYGLDGAVLDRFAEVVDLIAQSIESGVFPAVPGEYDSYRRSHDNCRYCPFDRLCPAGRDAEWDRVADDPALSTYWALDLPVDEAETEGDDDG